jgi:hypothetical protein
MLLDEVHYLFRANEKGELMALLDAGHYRWNALCRALCTDPER